MHALANSLSMLYQPGCNQQASRTDTQRNHVVGLVCTSKHRTRQGTCMQLIKELHPRSLDHQTPTDCWTASQLCNAIDTDAHHACHLDALTTDAGCIFTIYCCTILPELIAGLGTTQHMSNHNKNHLTNTAKSEPAVHNVWGALLHIQEQPRATQSTQMMAAGLRESSRERERDVTSRRATNK